MNRWIDATGRLLEWLLVLLMFGMVVLVFGNVLMRYGMNSGITISEELSRWFFVWMTFLGAAVGLKEHAHLGTDMLVSRLGDGGKRVCLFIAQLLMLVVTALVLKGSWAQALLSVDVEAPVSGWSMAWFNGVGVVFAVLTLPLLLRELWRTATGQVRAEDLVMVKESEDLPHGDGHKDA